MIDDEKKLVEVRIAGAIVSFEGESVRVCSCMLYVFFVIIHCLFMFLFICRCKGTEVGLVTVLVSLMCVGVVVCPYNMSYMA